MITVGFAGLVILLMFLIKWPIPVFLPQVADLGIEVNIELPEEDYATTRINGGGGGGNPVAAAGPVGAAPYSPPLPGEAETSKEIETDDNDKTMPEITKPANPQPNSKKIVENTSTVKTTPKPIVENPQPALRKGAQMGKTTSGTGRGGGAEDYDRTGGTGTGAGVGNGSGTGGGRGTGAGGGTGSGVGTGTGPKVTRGDRSIITAYSFQGDLQKATIYADIRVSADGTGRFVQFARGSSSTSSSYKNAIIQYLRNIKFNKADHESTVTVQFNFKVTG
jgi:hypothetical protein